VALEATWASIDATTEFEAVGSILAIDDSDIREELNRTRTLVKPGTCLWIHQKQWFVDWARIGGEGPKLLWLSGAPAAGKSVLATYIVDSIRSLLGDNACQFHALNFSDHTKRSASYLFRSLAYQVACALPSFRARIIRLSQVFGIPFSTMSAVTLWEKLFRGVLFSILPVTPLYWVIDGLDESDSIGTFFQCIKTFDPQCGIKILLLSRPTALITMHVKQLPYECAMHLISASDTYDDIRAYVTDVIGSIIPARVASRQRIADKVLSKASGNFLWVSLAASALEQSWHWQSNIDCALNEFPSEMTPLYNRMLQKIESHKPQAKHLAFAILAWYVGLGFLVDSDALVSLSVHRRSFPNATARSRFTRRATKSGANFSSRGAADFRVGRRFRSGRWSLPSLKSHYSRTFLI
jgi:hypothetical protein